MMKKLMPVLSLFLLLLFLPLIVQGEAVTGTCGDGLTWAFSDGILTISGEGTMEEYKSSDDQPWASIRKNISDLYILPGVTSISYLAFSDCDKLTTVTLPKSVTAIGLYAFDKCPLTNIYYEGTEANWNKIKNIASSNNDELSIYLCSFNYVYTEISGPGLTWDLTDGCLTISGTGAMTDYQEGTTPWYAQREDFTSIVVEENVTSIGQYAFADCSSLETVSLPSTLTAVDQNAFSCCSALSAVSFNQTLSEWGSLKSETTHNDALVNVASVNCQDGFIRDLMTYRLNEDEKTVTLERCDRNDFDICIPDSIEGYPVTMIGTNAFNGHGVLHSVRIPLSVMAIAANAFNGCLS